MAVGRRPRLANIPKHLEHLLLQRSGSIGPSLNSLAQVTARFRCGGCASSSSKREARTRAAHTTGAACSQRKRVGRRQIRGWPTGPCSQTENGAGPQHRTGPPAPCRRPTAGGAIEVGQGHGSAHQAGGLRPAVGLGRALELSRSAAQTTCSTSGGARLCSSWAVAQSNPDNPH